MASVTKEFKVDISLLVVANQRFPLGGAPTLEGVGAWGGGGGGSPTYDFAKFSRKLHEIKIILTPDIMSSH